MRAALVLALAMLALTSCAIALPPALPLAEPVPASAVSSFTWRPLRWTPGTAFSYDYRELMEATYQGQVERRTLNAAITLTVTEPTAAGLTHIEVAINGTRAADVYLGADGIARDATLVGKATDADRASLKSTVTAWQHPIVKLFATQPFAVNEPRRVTVSFAEMFGDTMQIRFIPDITLPVVTTFTGEKRVLKRRVYELRSSMQLPRSHAALVKDGAEQGQRAEVAGSFDTIQYFDATTGFPIASYNVSVIELFTPARATLRETSSLTISAR